MKALVLDGPGKLFMKDRPIRQPGDYELLVQTKAATICTSDLNDIKYNPFGIETPMVMGHEGAGIVVDVGALVKDFKPGDRISAHPVMACGKCKNCRNGLSHLCSSMEHLGLNREGVFAEYFCIRADRARKIPDDMEFPTASLMEPVSVCIEGIERANVKEGGICLIIGDGPFGIIISRLLEAYHLRKVIVVGRHPFRMGKTPHAVCINEHETEDVVQEVMRITDGDGVDSAILCAGTADAVNMGIACLKARGTLSVFSAVDGKAPIDLFQVHVKELNICGSCNDENYLDKALELLGDKKLGMSELITQRLSFEDWKHALELADHGKDEALKVTLTFDEGGEL